MSTWFKTINNLYCNKICNYIISGQSDVSVLNHLLEFELKGKIPTSLMVENPSKELLKTLPVFNRKQYISFWELAWFYKNFGVMNWLMSQPDFKLSESQISNFLNYETKVLQTLSHPELKPFILGFIQYHKNKHLGVVVNPSDNVPTSITYFVAPLVNDDLKSELLKSTPPQGFSDLRLLTESEWKMCWPHHKEMFPLLNDIEKFEGKQITFKYQVESNRSELFSVLNEMVKEQKLSVALKKVFNCDSKQMLKKFEPNFFIRKKTVVELNFQLLAQSLWIEKVFNPEVNASDFLSALDYDLNPVKKTIFSSVLSRSFAQILTQFNDQQKREVLNNLNLPSYKDLDIALEDYNRYTTYYNKLLLETEFKEINRLEKIINLILDHEEMASVPLSNLYQENHYPAISEVCKLSLPKNYSVIVAKTNHELITWGIDMGHCIGGEDYQEDAEAGDCLLIALALNGVPKYAVEIRDGELVQIQGKSSSRPDHLVQISLLKALEVYGLINR